MELADLTKYVMCLWQLWDYSVEEALKFTDEKSQLVEQRFLSEFSSPEPGQPVLVFDLDNTVFDFSRGFLSWLAGKKILSELHPEAVLHTLQNDIELGLPWHTYRELKDEWERSGGYARLEAYTDAVALLQRAQTSGWFLVAYTARPEREVPRVWLDSWSALSYWSVTPNQLRFGDGERLLYLQELSRGHRTVLYLEDNPALALRAARLGIRTVVRRHPYNLELEEGLELLPSLGLAEDFVPLLQEFASHAAT